MPLFSKKERIQSPAGPLHNILGVDTNATPQQIKKAYQKKALKWHPDRNRGNKKAAKAKFKEIGKAYEILSDPAKRKKYDISKGYTQSEDFYNFGFNIKFDNIQPFERDPEIVEVEKDTKYQYHDTDGNVIYEAAD